MATENGTTVPNQDPTKVTEPVESKGKGKAVAEDPADVSMDDDEEDSDEEVSSWQYIQHLNNVFTLESI